MESFPGEDLKQTKFSPSLSAATKVLPLSRPTFLHGPTDTLLCRQMEALCIFQPQSFKAHVKYCLLHVSFPGPWTEWDFTLLRTKPREPLSLPVARSPSGHVIFFLVLFPILSLRARALVSSSFFSP